MGAQYREAAGGGQLRWPSSNAWPATLTESLAGPVAPANQNVRQRLRLVAVVSMKSWRIDPGRASQCMPSVSPGPGHSHADGDRGHHAVLALADSSALAHADRPAGDPGAGQARISRQSARAWPARRLSGKLSAPCE